MGKTERRSHHPARGSQALFLPSRAASLFPQREMAAKSCLLPSKHSQGGWETPTPTPHQRIPRFCGLGESGGRTRQRAWELPELGQQGRE